MRELPWHCDQDPPVAYFIGHHCGGRFVRDSRARPNLLGVTPLHAHTHTHTHTKTHNFYVSSKTKLPPIFMRDLRIYKHEMLVDVFMRAFYLFDVYFRFPIRQFALDRSRHSTHYNVLRVLSTFLFRFSVTRHPLLKIRFPPFGHSARYNAFAFFLILKRKTGRFISAEFG